GGGRLKEVGTGLPGEVVLGEVRGDGGHISQGAVSHRRYSAPRKRSHDEARTVFERAPVAVDHHAVVVVHRVDSQRQRSAALDLGRGEETVLYRFGVLGKGSRFERQQQRDVRDFRLALRWLVEAGGAGVPPRRGRPGGGGRRSTGRG